MYGTLQVPNTACVAAVWRRSYVIYVTSSQSLAENERLPPLLRMTVPQQAAPRIIEVSYPGTQDLPLADATNYVHLSQGGFDILMSLGQVDITLLASAAPDTNGKVKVDATVTHRFMMSLGTFVQMRQLMDELARNMLKQGVKLPEPFPQEPK